MAFLNRFKKITQKKDSETRPQEAESSTKQDAPLRPIRRKGTRAAKTEEKKRSFLSSGEIGPAWRVLKKPRMSEKATHLSSTSRYVFEISSRAKKLDVKEAVEKSYGVRVMKVHIIMTPPKPRRLGRSQGVKSGYKKAIVTLKAGETIEVLPH